MQNELLCNSYKFTSYGVVKVTCSIFDNQIHFTVSDTGIGISKEMQTFIFAPFRQVETGMVRNFGGNGLGLALVKSYITK